ncbi:MAG: DUF2270 domain-containing protein [Chloroflexi bacterium]|nr:DUF2270 domain-containing protein [Chloroflexota bacterium]
MQPHDAQASPKQNPQPPVGVPSPDLQALWNYHGYQLDSGDFTAAMVHLYRAEITRANTWRNRLDVTTNWAMISTGAALSFAFSQTEAHHSVILLNLVLVTLFLLIEARRYRYYDLWSSRIRLMETNFFAALLEPPFKPSPEWARSLTQSLLHPRFSVSMLEAVGSRLRRNYIWIYLVLELAWLAKLLLYGESINPLASVVIRAHMGAIPGLVVIGAILVFDLVLLAVALWTRSLRRTRDEVV